MEYFAYIRVSTFKQRSGVSLTEQRRTIQQYAATHGTTISKWFEETQTAAHNGRRIFNQVLVRLEKHEASGLILHKIDRGARNLKDWSLIGELIDQGIDVRFAHENLDMDSRGGRLAADIQAVIAADYIRNLREEVKKGILGRLRQGFYPFKAPLGYLDRGAAQVKVPDPTVAPAVAYAFERYASGTCNLRSIVAEMRQGGLRNSRGGLVTIQNLSTVFNNPFYTGVIRIKRTGDIFLGRHEPIISAALFDQVQDILRGKTGGRRTKHQFLYRRFIKCACGYRLTGERQKGIVYYRCHTPTCHGTVRETAIEAAFLSYLSTTVSPEIAERFKGGGAMLREHLMRNYATHGTYENGTLSFTSLRRLPGEVSATEPVTPPKVPTDWRSNLRNQAPGFGQQSV